MQIHSKRQTSWWHWCFYVYPLALIETGYWEDSSWPGGSGAHPLHRGYSSFQSNWWLNSQPQLASNSISSPGFFFLNLPCPSTAVQSNVGQNAPQINKRKEKLCTSFIYKNQHHYKHPVALKIPLRIVFEKSFSSFSKRRKKVFTCCPRVMTGLSE